MKRSRVGSSRLASQHSSLPLSCCDRSWPRLWGMKEKRSRVSSSGEDTALLFLTFVCSQTALPVLCLSHFLDLSIFYLCVCLFLCSWTSSECPSRCPSFSCPYLDCVSVVFRSAALCSSRSLSFWWGRRSLVYFLSLSSGGKTEQEVKSTRVSGVDESRESSVCFPCESE